MTDDQQFLDIAMAIADGAEVDWHALASPGAGDTPDCDHLADRLRHLERLVRGHDALRSGTEDEAGAAPDVTLLTEAREGAGDVGQPLQVRWGPLVVTDKIGRGSFGDVYRAWDPKVEREVALKLIPDTGDGSARASIDEARRLARVRHPNVLTVYGAERIDGRVGLWMEFVPGRTLDAEIRERGQLPAGEVVQIGLEVSRALEAVHAAGLLHRDIKAHNVMREASGRIVLSDFGTSIEVDETAGVADPRIAGTPLYLAPEVLAGQPATTASDLYSLGVLLYHAATGDYPIRGSTLREIRRAHAEGRRVPLARARPDLPAHLIDVVDRLTAPDPSVRFPDASAVVAAIEARPGVRGHASHPWTWFAFSSAAVAVVAAVVWMVRDDRRQLPGDWATRKIADEPCTQGPRSGNGPRVCLASAGIISYDPATGDVRTLVPHPSSEVQITGTARSPAGDQLAYMVGPVARPPNSPPVERSVRLRDLATGDDRLLADLPSDALLLALRGWHPTGVFEFYMRQPNDAYALAHVAVDSGAFWTAFTFPSMPQGHATSPDGRLIAFDFQPPDQPARDIQVCAIVEGACAVVSRHPAHDFLPFWAPDGRLLFSSSRLGSYGLYRVALDGMREAHEPELVADLGSAMFWPLGFAETGELYYEKWVDPPDVYAAELQPDGPASALVRLSPTLTGQRGSAVWSPDGRAVAYVSQPGPFADPGATEIAVQSLDDGRERGFRMDLRFNSAAVAWSPDSRRLAVRAVLGDPALNQQLGIHVLDVALGRIVASWPASGAGFKWLDDRRLAYRENLGAGRTEVRYLDLATGEVTARWPAPDGESITDVALSYDRQSLALALCSRERSDPCRSTRLVVLPVDDGEVRAIGDHAGRVTVHDWMPDGQSLIIGIPDSANRDRTQLWRLPVGGGAGVPIGVPRAGVYQVRVHPDGTRLAFSERNVRREYWVANGLPR